MERDAPGSYRVAHEQEKNKLIRKEKKQVEVNLKKQNCTPIFNQRKINLILSILTVVTICSCLNNSIADCQLQEYNELMLSDIRPSIHDIEKCGFKNLIEYHPSRLVSDRDSFVVKYYLAQEKNSILSVDVCFPIKEINEEYLVSWLKHKNCKLMTPFSCFQPDRALQSLYFAIQNSSTGEIMLGYIDEQKKILIIHKKFPINPS